MKTILCLAVLAAQALAQRPTLSPATRQFVAIDTPVVSITHVRVIDGTGAPAKEDQTVVLRFGQIASIGPSPNSTTPNSSAPLAVTIDGSGKTLIPGLVMVHEHMFYPPNAVTATPTYVEHAFSFPKMYLAAGITTARTGGSMEPYADLNLRRWIDAGIVPGPKLDVTGPYLSGTGGAPLAQFRELKDSADARALVKYWADQGATSFKAYMWITRDELRASVSEAHKRGLKVTGHLCSVTYREAADAGIDNLEHGFFASSDFAANKQPDACPGVQLPWLAGLERTTIDAERNTQDGVVGLLKYLIDHHVALTSTLAIFESFVPGRPATQQRVLEAMSLGAKARFLQARAASAANYASLYAKAFPNDMALEKKFADMGGLLVVGTDPTGSGGVLAGYGSQRAIELLVEAGFTPLEAIKIATQNGATYLGRASRVGTIAVGKDADLVLINGNPGANIADIEKVELVFKDGIAYDSAKLFASVRGLVGDQ